jgi:hypothetical protein
MAAAPHRSVASGFKPDATERCGAAYSLVPRNEGMAPKRILLWRTPTISFFAIMIGLVLLIPNEQKNNAEKVGLE